MKRILLLTALFLSTIVQGQIVNFNFQNSGQASFNAQEISKITLENDSTRVFLSTGTIQKWPSTDIKSITYTEGTLVNEITKNPNISELNLFPNPSENNLIISLPGISTGPMTLRILDQNGRTVMNRRIEFDNNTYNLNIEALQSGIYTLVLNTESGLLFKEIIKL